MPDLDDVIVKVSERFIVIDRRKKNSITVKRTEEDAFGHAKAMIWGTDARDDLGAEILICKVIGMNRIELEEDNGDE
jgi:hypothetical protein